MDRVQISTPGHTKTTSVTMHVNEITAGREASPSVAVKATYFIQSDSHAHEQRMLLLLISPIIVHCGCSVSAVFRDCSCWLIREGHATCAAQVHSQGIVVMLAVCCNVKRFSVRSCQDATTEAETNESKLRFIRQRQEATLQTYIARLKQGLFVSSQSDVGPFH